MPGWLKKKPFKLTFKKKTSKKVKPKTSKATTQIVKQVVTKMLEKKTQQVYDLERLMYFYDTVNPFLASNIIPIGFQTTGIDIQQGTNQQDRIGNKITVQNLTFSYHFVYKKYSSSNPTPTPLQLKMFLVYEKETPSTQPTSLSEFFQFGSTATSPTIGGDLIDMWAPINKDRFTCVYSKIHKLGYASFNSAVGGDPASGNFANNDYHMTAEGVINYTKYLPKIVNYADNNIDSVSRRLWLIVLLANADGSQYATPNPYVPCALDYIINCTYTDA